YYGSPVGVSSEDLSVSFGRRIYAARIGRIALSVKTVAFAVEDVIGRDRHKSGVELPASGSEYLDTGRICIVGELLFALGPINVRIRCAIQDCVGSLGAESLKNCLMIRDIELGA